MGCSRSLKMAPFDRPYMTFYWSAIVNITLSCTVFELFDVEWYRDLEIWVRGHSRSFNMVPFESLVRFPIRLPSIVTMALSCINSEIEPDIGRKSWFFHTPLHSAPPLGGRRWNITIPFGTKKTRMVGIPDGETVYTQYRRVTDGRTDRETNGQTDRHLATA